ncbi:hypothetical protein M407DRAFT_31764 [Tulasnella calospora MUT 4182]|uniref:BTB domain-containing protein n=1 Tax=Tulasnella calospora MUT 4182 TaxID=1051891 RepID=A0A0C3KB00_9AGAM|nr:hypothetical protein M407DRAFT_31764 [Tulasnella calospora MUT 4182]
MYSQIPPSQAAAQAAIHRMETGKPLSNSGFNVVAPLPFGASESNQQLEHKKEHATRDPDFWVPESDAAVVFQAGNALFRVVPWVFKGNSAPLWDLCGLGKVEESNNSGHPHFMPNSETNPLVIWDTSGSEFRALMKWMDPRHHNDGPLTKADYRLILPAADRWDVDAAFQEAVEALDPLKFTIPHTERLCMAIMYDIPSWIRPTLEGLIRSNENMSEEDESRLRSFNVGAYRELMATRNRITQIRHKHLIRPPKVTHADACPSNQKARERCTAVWDRLWRDSCLHLIAIKEWVAPRTTLNHIQSAVEAASRTQEPMACAVKTLEGVVERGLLWLKEEDAEESGMHSILGPTHKLPPRDLGKEAPSIRGMDMSE